MAAHEHINQVQLRLFMTGQEAMDMLEPGDLVTPGMRPEVAARYKASGYAEKLDESKDWSSTGESTSLYEQIRNEGVKDPVTVVLNDQDDVQKLIDGHHRVATAAAQGKYVPVEYLQRQPGGGLK
jgi:hypothetical protein